MLNRHTAVISLALTGLLAFTPAAVAATVAESGVEQEVNSCVAEVRERMDYDGATHIKHDIVAVERRTVGYTMKISTSVFGEDARQTIRAYATECVVNGTNKPMKFEISEVN